MPNYITREDPSDGKGMYLSFPYDRKTASALHILCIHCEDKLKLMKDGSVPPCENCARNRRLEALDQRLKLRRRQGE